MCVRFTVLSDTHRFRNRRPRHTALAQQHHLNALALHRRNLPTQRRSQLSNLTLGAFDHPAPPNQTVTGNHIAGAKQRH
jgi:hypothetical protein